MLEAEYLAYVTSNIESLFNNLEEEILIDIARRIRQNDFSMTSTAQYQMDQLKALGIAEKDIQSLIAKTLKKSEKEVAKVIEESAYKTLESDNDIFKLAYERGAIPSFHYQPNAFKNLILSGVKATNGEIKNICKTAANKSQQAFINASDKVFLQVSSGAFDYESACLNAIKDLSSKGLGVINYRTGARRRLDGAIRNAVRTGLNQTACKCQDKNFDEMGGNLVETTSHMGARPEHALWQGQVFWRKKKYKNYRNFEQATGYGTGAGLGGWNCRHSFYPYFEEISSQAFEKYRLGENEEFYELTQEQRYNERKIREWSQRANICKAGGVDNSRELNKVREWKNKQKEFLKEHPELKRVYANEKTYGLLQSFKNEKSFKEIMSSKLNRLNSSEKEVITKMSGALSQKINFILGRNGKIDKFVKELSLIDSALSKGEIIQDITVYRKTDVRFLKSFPKGEKISEESIKSMVGKIEVNDIYTSTTLEPFEWQGRNTEIKMLVPKGTKHALYIKDLSLPQYKYQEEILFGRGLHYLIKEATIENGIVKLLVEVIK